MVVVAEEGEGEGGAGEAGVAESESDAIAEMADSKEAEAEAAEAGEEEVAGDEVIAVDALGSTDGEAGVMVIAVALGTCTGSSSSSSAGFCASNHRYRLFTSNSLLPADADAVTPSPERRVLPVARGSGM